MKSVRNTRGTPTRLIGTLTSAGVLAATILLAGGTPATAQQEAPSQALQLAPPNPDRVNHGLYAQYWAAPTGGARTVDFNTAPTGWAVEPNIDRNDATGSLKIHSGKTEHVAARFTGLLTPKYTEAYTFKMIGDNGFRVWVNNVLVIDHWATDWEVPITSAPINLTANSPVSVRVEYTQDTGGANYHLSWSSASEPLAPIPWSAFTLPTTYTGIPATSEVATTGKQVIVDLAAPITSLGATAGTDIQLEDGSGTAAKIAAIELDPNDNSRLVITPEVPLSSSDAVRANYKTGGLKTTGGAALGTFSVPALNNSRYYLATPWAEDVDPANVHGEYPRPQLTREKWQNLNGSWGFQSLASKTVALPAGALTDKILVPFPMESKLSGVAKHYDNSVYRRTFTVPADWNIGSGQRLKLNFGAVDYESWVYVNGTEVAHNIGGYLSFSADVTDALVGTGPQELTVRVFDSTDQGYMPTGKQTANPSGIFYTPTSGIWQDVWMEPTAAVSVNKLNLIPNVTAGTLAVTVNPGTAAAGSTVTATAFNGTTQVGTVSGAAGATLNLPVPNAHLWSPEDPFLYDLKVTITNGSSTETVGSYFGMRSIGLKVVQGNKKIVLNGQPEFVLSTLDQGFWPDGIYTAPTDKALKWDLDQHKELGFNAVRKHIKVEPARWYYWADKLGLLVIQDAPSGFYTGTAGQTNHVNTLHSMVDQLISVPSIVMWVPFNEGWGEWDKTVTGQVAESVKVQDPSRLVNAHSGVNCCASKGDSGKGDIIDWHQYTGPAFPLPDANRAAIDGEHGGFSLSVKGHMWSSTSVNPYGEVADSAALTAAYVKNTSKLIPAASCALSGSIYTQITDVEGEVNGFWTYDRKVMKMDPAAVKAVNDKVTAAGKSVGGAVDPGTPGLAGVGWWPLKTDAKDVVGTHNGSIKNGAAFVTSPSGGALQLNGSNQYVDTGATVLNTANDYSVAARVRLDNKGGFGTAVSIDGAENSAFFLQYSQADDRLAFSFAGSRALATTLGSPVIGTWYSVVGTYSHADQTLRIYVNGALAGSVKACATDPAVGNLLIGRAQFTQNGNTNAVDYWRGALSDVHAYDRALSASEVAGLAANEPPLPTSDSTTALELSAAQVPFGTEVTATVSVRSGGVAVDGGTVQVLVDGTVVKTAPVVAGTATVSLGGSVAIGTHAVTAKFSGKDRINPSTSAAASLSVNFTDVTPTHPFFADIDWAVDKGVVKGNPDGTFAPLDPVSRQAAAAFLYRAEHPGQTAPACTAKPFDDIAIDSTFCAEIQWLKSAGITTGTVSGSKVYFQPGASVSRQAMAAFLYRLANPGQADPSCTVKPFNDVPVTEQFCGVITWMKANGYTNGYDNGKLFRPGNPVDRQSAAAFIHRAYAA